MVASNWIDREAKRYGLHVSRNPWSTMAFAVIVGLCLGTGSITSLTFEARSTMLYVPQHAPLAKLRDDMWRTFGMPPDPYIMTVSRADGGSMITRDALLSVLALHEAIVDARVQTAAAGGGRGAPVGAEPAARPTRFGDVCMQRYVPEIGERVCAISSILELWEYDRKTLEVTSDAEVLSRVAAAYRKHEIDLGGVRLAEDGSVAGAGALMLIYYLDMTIPAFDSGETAAWELDVWQTLRQDPPRVRPAADNATRAARRAPSRPVEGAGAGAAGGGGEVAVVVEGRGTRERGRALAHDDAADAAADAADARGAAAAAPAAPPSASGGGGGGTSGTSGGPRRAAAPLAALLRVNLYSRHINEFESAKFVSDDAYLMGLSVVTVVMYVCFALSMAGEGAHGHGGRCWARLQRVVLGLMCGVSVGFSLVSGFGLACYLAVPLCPVSPLVVFTLLGVSVDDMLIIYDCHAREVGALSEPLGALAQQAAARLAATLAADAAPRARRARRAATRDACAAGRALLDEAFAEALAHAAAAITMTSATTLVALGTGWAVDFPVYSFFCGATGCCIACVFFFQATLFAPLLLLHEHAEYAHAVEQRLAALVADARPAESAPAAGGFGGGGAALGAPPPVQPRRTASGRALGVEAAAARANGCANGHAAAHASAPPAKPDGGANGANGANGGGAAEAASRASARAQLNHSGYGQLPAQLLMPSQRLMRVYARWLLRPAVSCAVLVVFACLVCACGLSARSLEVGLPQRDTVPDGSRVGLFLDDLDTHWAGDTPEQVQLVFMCDRVSFAREAADSAATRLVVGRSQEALAGLLASGDVLRETVNWADAMAHWLRCPPDVRPDLSVGAPCSLRNLTAFLNDGQIHACVADDAQQAAADRRRSTLAELALAAAADGAAAAAAAAVVVAPPSGGRRRRRGEPPPPESEPSPRQCLNNEERFEALSRGHQCSDARSRCEHGFGSAIVRKLCPLTCGVCGEHGASGAHDGSDPMPDIVALARGGLEFAEDVVLRGQAEACACSEVDCALHPDSERCVRWWRRGARTLLARAHSLRGDAPVDGAERAPTVRAVPATAATAATAAADADADGASAPAGAARRRLHRESSRGDVSAARAAAAAAAVVAAAAVTTAGPAAAVDDAADVPDATCSPRGLRDGAPARAGAARREGSCELGVVAAHRMVVYARMPQVHDDAYAQWELFNAIIASAGARGYVYHPKYEFGYVDRNMLSFALSNLGSATAAILCVLLLFLSPSVALLSTVAVFAIDVLLFGMMVMLRVRLNSITLISLLIALALAIDYSCHIGHAYEAAPGRTRHDKATHALETMGASILSAGTSTLIGTLFLSISRSAVFRTFFVLVWGTILWGLVCGLAVVPAALALFGPIDPAHALEPPRVPPRRPRAAHNGPLLPSHRQKGSPGRRGAPGSPAASTTSESARARRLGSAQVGTSSPALIVPLSEAPAQGARLSASPPEFALLAGDERSDYPSPHHLSTATARLSSACRGALL